MCMSRRTTGILFRFIQAIRTYRAIKWIDSKKRTASGGSFCIACNQPYNFICYLAYLTLARYKHHLGVTGWAGVEDSLHSFSVVAYTTLKVRCNGGSGKDCRVCRSDI